VPARFDFLFPSGISGEASRNVFGNPSSYSTGGKDHRHQKHWGGPGPRGEGMSIGRFMIAVILFCILLQLEDLTDVLKELRKPCMEKIEGK
jgi:hypothetical protein